MWSSILFFVFAFPIVIFHFLWIFFSLKKTLEHLFFFIKFLFLLYFTLQYCVGFAIHWHESTTGVHAIPNMNPPSTSLPTASPCTSPKHAVSCIGHRLVIRFLHDSIHVSMPFSQIIPPSPSPTESKSPLYTSVSLLLSCIQGHSVFFLNFFLLKYSWIPMC